MDQVQIPIEGNDAARWRQKCYDRMERLKAKVLPSSKDAASQPRLALHEETIGEKFSAIFELQKAVRNGDADRFVDVLEKLSSEKKLLLSAIFDQVTPAGDSLLHDAAYYGNEGVAELIGHHFPELLTKTNIKGDTPLHVAARSKKSEVIKAILSQYDAHNKSLNSSVQNNKDEDTLSRLTNEYGNTALHEAVGSKYVDGVTQLFEADKCVAHYLNKSSKSPLYLAVVTGDKEIIDILLEAPFPDDKPLPNCHGNSPLHAAIGINNTDLIEELVAKKKKTELMYLRDEKGETPLHYAATRGYVDGVRYLLNKSALTALELNAKGSLPIHLACKWDHVEVVKELLQQQCAEDSRVLVNKKGQNMLHVAARSGSYNVVKYLLRNTKLDVNEKDKNGNTPLHLASKNSLPNIIWCLIQDKRIDVNVINNKGLTTGDTFLVSLEPENEKTVGQWLSGAVLNFVDALESDKVRSISRKHRSVAPKVDGMNDMMNTTMVVATLIATVTFAAGFTVPGGVYSSDDPNPGKRGMAVLGKRAMFQMFVVSNTVAMHCSTLGSFLLLWAKFGDLYVAARFYNVAFKMLGIALLTVTLAFVAAVRLVVTNVPWLANLVTIIGIIFFCIISCLYILAVVPLGYNSSVPLLRQLSNFLLWISISLPKAHPKVKAKKFEVSASSSRHAHSPKDG